MNASPSRRKTFDIYSRPPYAAYFSAVPSRVAVDEAQPFRCTGGFMRRPARATKGADYALTAAAGACAPGGLAAEGSGQSQRVVQCCWRPGSAL